MDSMIGYNNERYGYFGRAAAKTDDAVNYIPSRLSALLMIPSAGILRISERIYSPGRAFTIWRRDRRKHLSPNSAQTESTCAGALGIRLGGLSYYGGVAVDKPFLGDDLRPAENKDIRRAGRLMYVSEALILVISLAIMALFI
jgi:adenosylcobinamide-phosphate synthase